MFQTTFAEKIQTHIEIFQTMFTEKIKTNIVCTIPILFPKFISFMT